MLSEGFKRRIDNTTSLKALMNEIEAMTCTFFELENQETKREMSEKIAYAMEKVLKQKGDKSWNPQR